MAGTKSINWTTENEAKMLRALVVHANVQCDKGAAERIAADLGEGVTSSAIITHIQVLRRKAMKDGAECFTATATTKKRAAPATPKKANKKAKLAKVKTEQSGSGSDATVMVPQTPVKGTTNGSHDTETPSLVARISPRTNKGVHSDRSSYLLSSDVDEETKDAIKMEEPSSDDDFATDGEYKVEVHENV